MESYDVSFFIDTIRSRDDFTGDRGPHKILTKSYFYRKDMGKKNKIRAPFGNLYAMKSYMLQAAPLKGKVLASLCFPFLRIFLVFFLSNEVNKFTISTNYKRD